MHSNSNADKRYPAAISIVTSKRFPVCAADDFSISKKGQKRLRAVCMRRMMHARNTCPRLLIVGGATGGGRLHCIAKHMPRRRGGLVNAPNSFERVD